MTDASESIITCAQHVARLKEAVAGRPGSVLLGIHNYPDPDAIAAAFAFRRLFAQWKVDSDIACGGGVGRLENRLMADLLDIPLREISTLDPENYKGSVFVDTQPEAGNHSIPPDLPVLAVLDHHYLSSQQRKAERFDGARPAGPTDSSRFAVSAANAYRDTRPGLGSSSALALGYYDAAHLEVDPPLATALFLGVQTDTSDLMREASEQDRSAYARLLPMADMDVVRRVRRPDLGTGYFVLMARALLTARRHVARDGDALLASVGEVEAPDLLSAVSDWLVQADGVRYALAGGWHGGSLYFSLRLRPPAGRGSWLMRATLEPDGFGGGHGMAAGGQLNVAPGEEAEALHRVFRRFLRVAGGDDTDAGVPLLLPGTLREGTPPRAEG